MKLTLNNKEIEITYNGDERKPSYITPADILGNFQKQLIDALNTRMYHCTKQVLDNRLYEM